jgi:hemolysin III
LVTSLSGTEVPPEAAADLFYDARRNIYYTKPAFRGWMHLIWFAASLVLGVLLLIRTQGDARVVAASIYATSVTCLFGASALYHRGNWSVAWRRRLQRLDHMMIFFLIAGTATPALLIATPGALGVTCLIVVWTLAITAASIHLAWMDAPELLVGGTFISLGWMAGLGIPGVWMHAGPVPGALVLAGGLLYIVGTVCFRLRRPDPHPSVFGFHEVFHTFVCAAAGCQYAAMALLLVKRP